jgi:hypothetical protein
VVSNNPNLNAIPFQYTPPRSSSRHHPVIRPIERCRRPCPGADLEEARTVPGHHTSAEEVAFRRHSAGRSILRCYPDRSNRCSTAAGECTVERARRCCYCSRVLRCCLRQDEQPSRCRRRVGDRPCDDGARLSSWCLLGRWCMCEGVRWWLTCRGRRA